jgi:hypothetical protein
MPSLDAIKLKARRDLHKALQRPAFCYFKSHNYYRAIPITVRTHNNWGALGDVAGTSIIYAERRDVVKQELIFLAEERVPENGDVIMVTPVEGYIIDDVDPTYNITVRAGVISLPAERLKLFPAPPGVIMYMDVYGYLGVGSGEIDL